jgi:hypothetical protein
MQLHRARIRNAAWLIAYLLTACGGESDNSQPAAGQPAAP